MATDIAINCHAINKSKDQLRWLKIVHESSVQTLNRIAIPFERITINFDSKFDNTDLTFPVVQVSTLLGENLVENLFATPRESNVLHVKFLIRFTPARQPKVYGPVSIRFGEHPNAATWNSLAQLVGFHAVLSLRSQVPNVGVPSSTTNMSLARSNSMNLFASRLKKAILNRLSGNSRKRLQWGIGFVKLPDQCDYITNFDSLTVSWIDPPLDRFWADPQLFSTGDKLYMFFEELVFSRNIGTLHCAEIDPRIGTLKGAGIPLEFIPAITEHLSFPNIFEVDGILWMIPEVGAAGETRLYRCIEFPHRWQFERVLVDKLAGIDPVICIDDGVVYLFVGDGLLGNYDNNLRLFVSDSIQGSFVEHPCSPIALGLNGSRMAGKIIRRNGKLFRFGQNCSLRYGASICVFEITQLSESKYEERFVRSINPDTQGRYTLGLHTFSVAGDFNFLAIDGLRLIEKA
jgi:hypothetical protein